MAKSLIFTSLSISPDRLQKFEECAQTLGISKTTLLSVLCYKASLLYKKIISLKAVGYQPRSGLYKPAPVYFISSDHEFMHSKRLSCKLSVSFLISRAIDLYIDEIREHGINQMEVAHLKKIQHSYSKTTYYNRDFTLKVIYSDQFEEYIMKMRYEKT
jgi:hypothetical protein